MIGGFSQPDIGEIIFEGTRVKGPGEKLLPGHHSIAYLSQHFELRNNYFVREILDYGNRLSKKETGILYSVCRIDYLLNRRTDQLSGGERQRIALAKLLTASPQLLLLDEPFSNLDSVHKNSICSVLSDLKDRLNVSCIMVSHDAADILEWADRIIVMKAGSIIQEADPKTVYYFPVNEYCAALTGEYNLIEPLDDSEKNKKLFCRPEEIAISSIETAWKGKVKECKFRGNYYMLEVETERQTIKVFSTGNKSKPGDIVFLSLIETEHARWDI